MGLYSKFNVNLNINDVDYIDCRAFYLRENGKIQRIGGDEFNNCECLTESEVELIALSLNIPFSSLKTEEEIQKMKEGLKYIVKTSNGKLRDAINVLEKLINNDQTINIENIISITKPLHAVNAMIQAIKGNFEQAKNMLS